MTPLEYAKLGYPVLPLEGKQPLTRLAPNGKNSATSDQAIVAQLLRLAPRANWGIVPPSNALVLDVDDPEQLPELLREYPTLGAAPHCLTGSGGSHIWLRLPKGVNLSSSIRKLPGIDLRGMGKTYLVAPPSIHPQTRKPYQWVNPLVPVDALPECPEALLKRLLPAPPAQHPQHPPSLPKCSTAQMDGLLRRACQQVASAPKGQRHNTLLNRARLVGGWGLGGDAVTALAQAGISAGLPAQEAQVTAQAGYAHGQASPLALPHAFGSLPYEPNISAFRTANYRFGSPNPPDNKPDLTERLPWKKRGEHEGDSRD